MAQFIASASRLFFGGKPKQGMDEEAGPQRSSNTDGPGSSQLGGGDGGLTRSTLIPTDDSLTLFRLMTGITTSPLLGFAAKSPVGTRPAPNLGIYTRVVHNEQKAKDSFKVFSVVVNACYGLQIVVASALTAMGAANTSHAAITAFGAINTIIAGFLTFLKGSGLPNRLKYYGNEWKKIREYIEQRERDFSREGCTLNVYEVVATIEKMYEHTKTDIEVNTPDGYNSVTNAGRRGATPHAGHDAEKQAGGFDLSKLEGLTSKLKGLDGHLGGKVKDFVEDIEHKAHGVTKNVQDHEKEITKEVHDYEKEVATGIKTHGDTIAKEVKEHEAQIARDVREREQQTARAVNDGRQQITRGASEHGQRLVRGASEQGQQLAADARQRQQEAVDNASSGIQGYTSRAVNQLASNLTGGTLTGESTHPAGQSTGQSSQPAASRPHEEQSHDRTIA